MSETPPPRRPFRREYTTTPAIASASRRVGGLSRHRDPDDKDLARARRDLRYELFREHARAAVAGWPTFTPEQLGELGLIIFSSLPAPGDGRG